MELYGSKECEKEKRERVKECTEVHQVGDQCSFQCGSFGLPQCLGVDIIGGMRVFSARKIF